ncbi:MAG: CoA-binding protein [Deltaproteobacteria bacterium]|nr:CoA-binding protein [Deltaproteobacteria bacterium]
MPQVSENPRYILENAVTIAVLGAHDDPARASHYVPAYLHRMGYRIIPVNPMRAGEVWWGEVVRADLSECPGKIDLIDVFRRADLLQAHLAEILAMRPLPTWVWLQLGIRHDAFAASLRAHGIGVVQDRCTLADHQHFGLPSRSARGT